jgi:hypothetical protein
MGDNATRESQRAAAVARKSYMDIGLSLGDPLYGWRIVAWQLYDAMLNAALYKKASHRSAVLQIAEQSLEAMVFVLRSIRYDKVDVNDPFSRGQLIQNALAAYERLIVFAMTTKDESILQTRLRNDPATMAQPAKDFKAAFGALFTEIVDYIVERGDAAQSLSRPSIASKKNVNERQLRFVSDQLALVLALYPISVRAEKEGAATIEEHIKLHEKIAYNNELFTTLMYDAVEMTPAAAEQINLAILRKVNAIATYQGVALPPPLNLPDAEPVPTRSTPSPPKGVVVRSSAPPQTGTMRRKPPPPEEEPSKPARSAPQVTPERAPIVGTYQSAPSQIYGNPRQ